MFSDLREAADMTSSHYAPSWTPLSRDLYYKKVNKEDLNPLYYLFEVGDLVVVTVTDTSVNPVCVYKSPMR